MDKLSNFVSQQMQKYPNTDDFIKELEYLIEKAALSEDKTGDVFLDVGVVVLKFSNFVLAIALWNKALKYYLKLGNKTGESGCYDNIGVAYRHLGEFNKAIKYHNTALEMSKTNGDKEEESNCYINLGNVYNSLGEFNKAIEYLSTALEIKKQIGDKVGISRCYTNIGISYSGLGDFNKAIECYNQALEQQKEIGGDVTDWELYNDFGVIYHDFGNDDKAIEYLNQALEIAKAIKNKAGESTCYCNLGNVYNEKGHCDEAIEYLNQALEIAKAIKNKAGESACYRNLGNSYHYLGEFNKAIEYLNQALEIVKAIGNKAGESACYCNLGNSYRCLGEFNKAIEYYNKAKEMTSNVIEKKSCYNNIGWAYLEQNQYEESQKYFEEGIKILETIKTDKISKDPKERKEFLKAHISLFDGMVISQIKTGNKEAALVYSEMGKGKTIFDFFGWQGKKEKGFIPIHWDRQKIQVLSNKIQKTIVLLRVTAKGTYAFIVTPNGEFKFVEIKDFTSERLHELMSTKKAAKSFEGLMFRYFMYRYPMLAKQVFIQGDVNEEVLYNSRAKWLSSLENTLKVIYQELIEKVFKEIKQGEKIVIIPNKSLNSLPLHACFYENEGERHFLIEDYEITYAPNCDILNLSYMRENENRERNSLFAIGNPTLGLEFSEYEVKAIKELFVENECYINCGRKEKLLEKIGDYGIIHLATHGEWSIMSAFNSSLLFENKEFLTLNEIFEKIKIPKNWLVVLSACESGLTDHRDVADEYIGLQAGFLYAGAPTVIGSLWVVDDASTALLMRMTYENIFKNGLSKAEALRKAQLWLKNASVEEIEEKKEKTRGLLDFIALQGNRVNKTQKIKPYSHPYYWAGFQIFGAG